MKICGPKFSICCTLISVWGIVQLGLMGIFFYVESPALLEDLFIPEGGEEDPDTYIKNMQTSYGQIAINCWIATAMYVGSFALSGWQMYLNLKSS